MAQIQVTVEWDDGNSRWQFIRWAVQEPDNRYVLEQGDTMTGNLLFNDGSANTAINVDGSATFAGGDGIATNNSFGITTGGNINIRRDTASNAAIQVRNGTGAAGVGAVIHGDGKLAIGNSPTHTTGNIQLNADGSASFAAGGVTIATDGDITSDDTITAQAFIGNQTTAAGTVFQGQQDGTVTTSISAGGAATFNENGAAVDFRVESDGNPNMLVVDGSANMVGIGTSAPGATLDVRGSAVFNEDSANVDFRVESDGNENMLFVDGSNSRVGIGTNSPSQVLEVAGTAQINGAAIIRSGNVAQFQNTANTRNVSINADDVTTTYTMTLPPGTGTANQVLEINSISGTDIELGWVDNGAGATTNAISQGDSNVTVTDTGSNGQILAITDNTTRLTIPTGTGTATTDNAVITANGIAAFQVPAGTTAQRPGETNQPAGAAGQFRYNTTLEQPEYWDDESDEWRPFWQSNSLFRVLMIGGGGGGGGSTSGYGAGGGGAGAMLANDEYPLEAQTISFSVGTGGAGTAAAALGVAAQTAITLLSVTSLLLAVEAEVAAAAATAVN